MRKIAIILVIALMSVFVFGCSCDEDEDTQSVDTGLSDVNYFVDRDTGVNYIIYSGVYKGGITPRLNPDGTVMVTKKVSKKK